MLANPSSSVSVQIPLEKELFSISSLVLWSLNGKHSLISTMTEKHTYTWLFSGSLFSESGQNNILGQAKHVDIKISLQKILQQIHFIS